MSVRKPAHKLADNLACKFTSWICPHAPVLAGAFLPLHSGQCFPFPGCPAIPFGDKKFTIFPVGSADTGYTISPLSYRSWGDRSPCLFRHRSAAQLGDASQPGCAAYSSTHETVLFQSAISGRQL